MFIHIKQIIDINGIYTSSFDKYFNNFIRLSSYIYFDSFNFFNTYINTFIIRIEIVIFKICIREIIPMDRAILLVRGGNIFDM